MVLSSFGSIPKVGEGHSVYEIRGVYCCVSFDVPQTSVEEIMAGIHIDGSGCTGCPMHSLEASYDEVRECTKMVMSALKWRPNVMYAQWQRSVRCMSVSERSIAFRWKPKEHHKFCQGLVGKSNDFSKNLRFTNPIWKPVVGVDSGVHFGKIKRLILCPMGKEKK